MIDYATKQRQKYLKQMQHSAMDKITGRSEQELGMATMAIGAVLVVALLQSAGVNIIR